MGEFYMKKWIYFPILGLVAGELLIFDGKVLPGLGIDIINLLFITLLIIFGSLSLDTKNILQGLMLVILLRVVNLSMPQFFTTSLLQYPLIYGIMFIPIYNTVRNQQISSKELGINFNRFYIYLPIAILIGIIMAIVEYRIISPTALIDNIRFSNIALIGVIMIAFIGTVEEIIFRPILQTRLNKVFGLRYSILLSGIIFGIMHSTYGIVNEMLFATIFGIILGYIFHETKSLPFTISIHGIANIMLFGILPGMSIISNSVYPPEVISIGGEFMVTFLIIIFIISSLLIDTKYWNTYISNTLNVANPMLLILIAIVIYKIIIIIL